jgi:hypothetical protein
LPTTRPRHTVTETDQIARAIDDAARRWPEDASRRAALLVRLVEAGHAMIRKDDEAAIERRREAVRRTKGILSGVYPPGYLERLREDWPE